MNYLLFFGSTALPDDAASKERISSRMRLRVATYIINVSKCSCVFIDKKYVSNDSSVYDSSFCYCFERRTVSSMPSTSKRSPRRHSASTIGPPLPGGYRSPSKGCRGLSMGANSFEICMR